MAVFEGTVSVVGPEGTGSPQDDLVRSRGQSELGPGVGLGQRPPHSVVSEIILLRQLLDAWVDLEVVEDVDALHVTETVVQFSCQLSRGNRPIRNWPFQNKASLAQKERICSSLQDVNQQI